MVRTLLVNAHLIALTEVLTSSGQENEKKLDKTLKY